jgi:molecular chaperone GrpE (heat shock protein)
VSDHQGNEVEADGLAGEETQVEAEPEAPNDARREAEDWRHKAYRAAADLENFRKRVLKEKDELKKANQQKQT